MDPNSTKRPLIVHNLSDTGVMSFQGLHLHCQQTGSALSPAGVVWDSCVAERPVVTIPKGLVLCAINWLARMKDGTPFLRAVRESRKDFVDLAWNNYVRRLRGEECLLSVMEGEWCGDWARQLDLTGQELFFYSKNDVYVSYKWLQEEVIPGRRRKRGEGGRVQAVCWDKSAHVAHIKHHPEDY